MVKLDIVFPLLVLSSTSFVIFAVVSLVRRVLWLGYMSIVAAVFSIAYWIHPSEWLHTLDKVSSTAVFVGFTVYYAMTPMRHLAVSAVTFAFWLLCVAAYTWSVKRFNAGDPDWKEAHVLFHLSGTMAATTAVLNAR